LHPLQHVYTEVVKILITADLKCTWFHVSQSSLRIWYLSN